MGARKTYWITDRKQVEAIAHPARHEIMDRLVALGPMSPREIASTLGRKVTPIYHHLKLLEKVGLIKVSSVSVGGHGRPSVVYRAIAARVRLLRAAIDPKLREPIAKWAKLVASQASKDYVSGLSHPSAKHTGSRRNLYINRLVITPSPQRLARINELLNEVAELAWTPDPNPGPQLSIGWFISPLERGGPKKQVPSKKYETSKKRSRQ